MLDAHKIKGHLFGCPFILLWMFKGLETIKMQISYGHLFAADFGGSSMVFTNGENVIKSRLAENDYRLDTRFLLNYFDY